MKITLCKNLSENNKIGKNLVDGVDLEGTLRDASNVISPSILIQIENPTGYNYCKIESFGRSYFISEIQSVRTNLWLLSLSVDVLESFKEGILKLSAIISGTESKGDTNYVSGDQWFTNVKKKTDILTFPSGLLENGEYILITAGGE